MVDQDKLKRKELIARKFGTSEGSYSMNARVQERVSKKFAAMLPALKPDARILEIGCGTGFLTKCLIEKYPNSQLHITDLSEEMLHHCKSRFGENARCYFSVMDGEAPKIEEAYDLIVSAMTVQWFDDASGSLANLRSLLRAGGEIYYATIGENCFKEWSNVLAKHDVDAGVIKPYGLPGVFDQEDIVIEYGSVLNFLKEMKATGAATPVHGYMPISAGVLREVARAYDACHGGCVKWHIVYGKLSED